MNAQVVEYLRFGRKFYTDLIEMIAASASLIVRPLNKVVRMLTIFAMEISVWGTKLDGALLVDRVLSVTSLT